MSLVRSSRMPPHRELPRTFQLTYPQKVGKFLSLSASASSSRSNTARGESAVVSICCMYPNIDRFGIYWYLDPIDTFEVVVLLYIDDHFSELLDIASLHPIHHLIESLLTVVLLAASSRSID